MSVQESNNLTIQNYRGYQLPFFAKISNLLHFKAILINMGVKRGLIRRPVRWWTFRSRRWKRNHQDDFLSLSFSCIVMWVFWAQCVPNKSVGLCAAIFLWTSLCHFEIFSQGAARAAYKKKWQTGVRLSINSIITHPVQSNPPPSLLLILLAMFCHVLRTSLRDESDGVDKNSFA